MKIAVYGRHVDEDILPYFKTLMDEAQRLGHELFLFDSCYNLLRQKTSLSGNTGVFATTDDLKNRIDCMISLGGDGTMLDTVMLVRNTGIPVLGLNTGRLGYLTSIGADKIVSALEELDKNNFAIDKRVLLRLETNKSIFGEGNFALNELTIHKKDSSSMIKIHAFLNGEFLTTYWADGLIISTPTGSTGYSLSCGGPIVAPRSGNFVITPIAPHNLNVRPVVVSDRNVVSLEVEGRSTYFLASLDSRSVTIDASIQVAVRREDFTFNIIRLYDENFLKTLRNKLNWGLDSRN
jgi:NAD+ kinase